MSNIIGIVNYGIAGNIHSIEKAIKAAGGKVVVINHPSQFNDVDKLVLPGVGSFKDAMQELENDGFIIPIKENKKPILGICLGMQILATVGFEYGKTVGLNFIDAEVKPILVDAKVPHVGFNNIEVIKKNSLLNGLEKEEFYFMHSFEVVNYTNIVTLSEYANHKFVSSVQKDNIYGVQFHPEKSREAGIKLFKNFIEL
ncbi:MAG: imidazole glycerol phosphate synthase subunit HisH [Arcobacter sp.]|nr:imidazole glycerol phosphate synthase subunit HisH [Arcobacter sp.]|tara:strand:+ start:7202 stop:7798 length:597 start_codon:yes stop_codon:yes gene_type:complete